MARLMTDFVAERSRIMGFAKPNSGRELLAMKTDIEYHLIEGGVADSCQTEATGNPMCLLYVSGASRQTVDTVARRLDYTFNENIRYGGETTYQIECTEDTVVLDFATCASANLLVTGCIAITCR